MEKSQSEGRDVRDGAGGRRCLEGACRGACASGTESARACAAGSSLPPAPRQSAQLRGDTSAGRTCTTRGERSRRGGEGLLPLSLSLSLSRWESRSRRGGERDRNLLLSRPEGDPRRGEGERRRGDRGDGERRRGDGEWRLDSDGDPTGLRQANSRHVRLET